MLLLAIPVSTANTVYQVSLITLLIGAAVVLISAITLIWSGSIRENDLSSRLTNLQTTSAQATDEVARAHADVIDLKQQLASATHAAAEAQKEAMEAKLQNAKPVATSGRQITAENCGLFINYVRTVLKGKIILEANSSDAEAINYARQMADMLKSAGYDLDERFGSPTLLGQPPVGVQMRIRSMDEQPPYAGTLQSGLEFIGIGTSGSLDDTAADVVIVYVGTKP